MAARRRDRELGLLDRYELTTGPGTGGVDSHWFAERKVPALTILHFPYDEFYLKSAEEMARVFGNHKDILFNTVDLADRVEDFLKVGGMRLPKFDLDYSREQLARNYLSQLPEGNIPDSVQELHKFFKENTQLGEAVEAIRSGKLKIRIPEIPQGKTPYEFLCELAAVGMKKLKWDNSKPHIDQLKLELGDVKVALDMNNMDFATYFLIVWDYIAEARRKKIITGCGRGSGYASVLLRTLGITYGPDPLKYGLLWERFLGFDDKFILLDSDWGFGNTSSGEDVVLATDDIDEERVVEDDQGGVDRY